MKPKRARAPHVWIVEMRVGSRWEPCCSASLTRINAKGDLKEWRENNPSDKFRITKYVRGGK